VTRLTGVVPPASWTVVMASGVITVDLSTVHQPVLSTVMLGLGAAVWLFLAAVLGPPLLGRHGRFGRSAGSPVSLTAVAATAVLGTGLAVHGYRVAAAALLVIAVIGWAVLVVPVLRHWKTPTVGVSFVLGVATDGVAVLSVTLALAYRTGWLLSAAALFLLLGLAFYVFTAARFDLRQLIDGRGDHWIAGGALAISTLCAGMITEAAGVLGRFGDQHRLLLIGTLVLWGLAVAWLLPLIITEAIRPRLGYDVRRFATVFPFGMYGACSFTVGQVTGITWMATFGRVWTWVAVAAMLLGLVGLFRSTRNAWRASGSQDPALQKGQRDGSR
jgi:Voltage-dependent anion channel